MVSKICVLHVWISLVCSNLINKVPTFPNKSVISLQNNHKTISSEFKSLLHVAIYKHVCCTKLNAPAVQVCKVGDPKIEEHSQYERSDGPCQRIPMRSGEQSNGVSLDSELLSLRFPSPPSSPPPPPPPFPSSGHGGQRVVVSQGGQRVVVVTQGGHTVVYSQGGQTVTQGGHSVTECSGSNGWHGLKISPGWLGGLYAGVHSNKASGTQVCQESWKNVPGGHSRTAAGTPKFVHSQNWWGARLLRQSRVNSYRVRHPGWPSVVDNCQRG